MKSEWFWANRIAGDQKRGIRHRHRNERHDCAHIVKCGCLINVVRLPSEITSSGRTNVLPRMITPTGLWTWIEEGKKESKRTKSDMADRRNEQPNFRAHLTLIFYGNIWRLWSSKMENWAVLWHYFIRNCIFGKFVNIVIKNGLFFWICYVMNVIITLC